MLNYLEVERELECKKCGHKGGSFSFDSESGVVGTTTSYFDGIVGEVDLWGVVVKCPKCGEEVE